MAEQDGFMPIDWHHKLMEARSRRFSSAREFYEFMKEDFRKRGNGAELPFSYPTYAAYENGTRTPKLETFVQLARYLDLSLDYLLDFYNADYLQNILQAQKYQCYQSNDMLYIQSKGTYVALNPASIQTTLENHLLKNSQKCRKLVKDEVEKALQKTKACQAFNAQALARLSVATILGFDYDHFLEDLKKIDCKDDPVLKALQEEPLLALFFSYFTGSDPSTYSTYTALNSEVLNEKLAGYPEPRKRFPVLESYVCNYLQPEALGKNKDGNAAPTFQELRKQFFDALEPFTVKPIPDLQPEPVLIPQDNLILSRYRRYTGKIRICFLTAETDPLSAIGDCSISYYCQNLQTGDEITYSRHYLENTESQKYKKRLYLWKIIDMFDSMKKWIEGPASITILTNNKYLDINLTNGIRKWLQNGFLTAQKEPVTYQKEWKEIAKLLSHHIVTCYRISEDSSLSLVKKCKAGLEIKPHHK